LLETIDNPDLWELFKDDPVRPHLNGNFRTSLGRDAFLLRGENNQPRAIICCAYTNQVPKDEDELDRFSQAACQDDQLGNIAVFYTVWSYDRGAGRDIVFAARNFTRDNKGCKRFVTLSPLTEMAEKFHTRNGAWLIGKHSSCQNFEYGLD
jgi:hypothetical protein